MHLALHHYPAYDHRSIRRLTLRQLLEMVADIPHVSPHYDSPDEGLGDDDDGGLPPGATQAEREQFKKYGAVVR